MTALYVLVALMMGWAIGTSGALLVAAICVLLAIVFGAGMLLPRERWAWVYGIVTIAIGLTSCATLPFCIPLLIFWIKPEVQAHFDQRYERGIRD